MRVVREDFIDRGSNKIKIIGNRAVEIIKGIAHAIISSKLGLNLKFYWPI
jgi:hypothetical protein